MTGGKTQEASNQEVRQFFVLFHELLQRIPADKRAEVLDQLEAAVEAEELALVTPGA